MMPSFLRPNLDRTGRVVRLVYAALLIAGALVAFHFGKRWGWWLIGFAGFALFEAARAWCVVRACGIKTKY